MSPAAVAVALEPRYADVYAALSLAEKSASFLTVSTAEFVRGQRRALAAAEQAIARDPTLADGYAARGAVRIESWDWAGAQADLEKARALNPENISTYACSAFPRGAAGSESWTGHLPESCAKTDQTSKSEGDGRAARRPDHLRDDPRYSALPKKMGLPE